MFSFFGLFTNLAPALPEELLGIWPECDVVEFKSPYRGLAVRFSRKLYEPESEDMPTSVSDEVKRLSTRHTESRFILLRTECYGGPPCINWGLLIQNGEIIDDVDGEGALRRLIAHFGVDIGEREVFEPLTRTFPGNPTRVNTLAKRVAIKEQEKGQGLSAGQERIVLFKKNKKTFTYAVADSPESPRQHWQKFLLLFKRSAFLT